MPIGVIINALSVLLGGLVGAFIGKFVPERVRVTLSIMFGVCSMCMGIKYIGLMQALPAVILAVIVGVAIGELVYLEKGISSGIGLIQKPLGKIISIDDDNPNWMPQFIAIVVLFCASGTGIFGAIESGITGVHDVLLTKSILDFFTALTFAITLGPLVALICVPQFIILILLFFGATYIPEVFTSDLNILNDFKACGGVLMLATGLRISGIKSFPIANMIPAMILVMPFSYLWTNSIVPLLLSLAG